MRKYLAVVALALPSLAAEPKSPGLVAIIPPRCNKIVAFEKPCRPVEVVDAQGKPVPSKRLRCDGVIIEPRCVEYRERRMLSPIELEVVGGPKL